MQRFEAEELDDEHPLWLINEQIKGLLEGDGAAEDHESVLAFLRATGLPDGTVKRMHKALVWGDTKVRTDQTLAMSGRPESNEMLTLTICENDKPNLMRIWAEADKKAKDWREAGEVKLLEQMQDAMNGLKSLGWRDGQYAPRDGTRFLAIEVGSTGAFPSYWQENKLMEKGGGFWAEAHGDLWPAEPSLWKPMPSNVK